MKHVYVVKENSDQTEGRGPMRDVAYFTKAEAARRCAQGRGVMGVGNGEVEEVVVYESYDDYKRGEKAKLRAKALSKLTPDEKSALGLSE